MILWIIYTLWIMLGVICGVLTIREGSDIFIGLWLCSAIVMLYTPFIIGV